MVEVVKHVVYPELLRTKRLSLFTDVVSDCKCEGGGDPCSEPLGRTCPLPEALNYGS